MSEMLKSQIAIINQIIESCNNKTCFKYNDALLEILKNDVAILIGDVEIYKTFIEVTGYNFVHDAITTVFPPIILFSSRSRIPEDLTPQQQQQLFDSLSDIKDDEIKARICDILWSIRYGKEPHKIAEDAIKYYLRSASRLSATDSVESISRYHRAVRLFMGLGLNKRNELSIEINAPSVVRDIIVSYKEQKGFIHSTVQLIMIYYKLTRQDVTEHIDFMFNSAKECELANRFGLAREIWEGLKILSKDNVKIREYGLNIANTYFQEALIAEKDSKPSAMKICALLERAISAYRLVKDSLIFHETVYTKYREWQLKIADEMQTHPFEFDCSKEANEVIKHVSGKEKITALMCLAGITEPISMSYVKNLMMQDTSVLSSIFTTHYFDEEYKNVHVSDENDTEDNKCYRFIKDRIIRKSRIGAYIYPAWITLREQHCLTMNEWWMLLQHRTFVPPDRVDLFVDALYYGFNGDFITFAHLIIPQIENAFRNILKHLHEPSKILPNLAQESKNLDWALVTHGNELGALIGEDVVFDLRGLLIEKSGSNFRHNLSHGLSSSRGMYEDSFYLYWLVLYMIFNSVKYHQQSK